MSFNGKEIIFGGVPSGYYNLYLSTPDGEENEKQAGSYLEPIVQELFRRPVPYLLGVRYTPVLEFDLALNTPDEMDAKMAQLALRWCTGTTTYSPLRILQDDLSDVHFNCLITNAMLHRVGNSIRGLRLHVRCDSQWAWETDRTVSQTKPDNWVGGISFSIYNQTDYKGYSYPIVSFTTAKSGVGDIYITNSADPNRAFEFTDLDYAETITVNNDIKTISSDKSLFRLGNFNKKWFRLLPGLNTIDVTGNIYSVSITYKTPRMIG